MKMEPFFFLSGEKYGASTGVVGVLRSSLAQNQQRQDGRRGSYRPLRG